MNAPIANKTGRVSTPSLSSFATLNLNTLLAIEKDNKNHEYITENYNKDEIDHV